MSAEQLVEQLKNLVIVGGPYGAGKTNFSLNLALDSQRMGFDTTLVDLDVVNPYFRSSEYRQLMEEAGVTLIAPIFAEAGTSLDVPSLSGAVMAAITTVQHRANQGERVRLIIDCGGDDVGARTLGRFATEISKQPYDFVYLFNLNRSLDTDEDSVRHQVAAIEQSSRLVLNMLGSNSHLKGDTLVETVEAGIAKAQEIASETGLPLAFACLPKRLVQPEMIAPAFMASGLIIYPVEILVKTPWE